MKGVMIRKLLAIILLLSLLIACAPGANDWDNDLLANIAVDTIIIYGREGGFAGMNQEWVIHLDGTIDAPGDQELTVPQEDVQELVEKGMEADFAALASETAKTEICCDQMTYTLTVISGDDEWRLVTTDSADQSKEVTELFIMVQSLIDEAQPSS
jgi:hypothetical protein